VLVFIVMYLFLQNIRATSNPTLAVPVGVAREHSGCCGLWVFVNTLTMLGHVLAIGLLGMTDCLSVENVERIMEQEHMVAGRTRKSGWTDSPVLDRHRWVLSCGFPCRCVFFFSRARRGDLQAVSTHHLGP